jgi:alkylhydroperoxidase/carboxymuconolactone decarboxylase family protein YurZ
MSVASPKISDAFETFMREAPAHAQVWGGMVQGLAGASALDGKTFAPAYLAVLAALLMESGILFHVQTANQQDATWEEVINAILVGLPAAGHIVTPALPEAITAFDEHRR